jgi:sodium/potassium-transporting ATPase subunit alpha
VTDIKVDNSSLTGEAEPQERHPVPDGSKHRPVEAENVVCCSTVHQSVTALLGPGQR